MAYKVLYRKYRPDSFEKIIGQDTIVEILKNSVKDGSFSHAYIFTGPRGTGKTSTAKVLAKAINCTDSKDGEACGKCDSCENFITSPDIIEIDAASNNGVDEIRELRNNITLAPAASKYKIYIIDEVHMLSPGAFNALLKTLEEPPAHAIFILATTEVYKVPITILSRCQRYDFKKVNEKELVSHLKEICKLEKISYEEDALKEIYSLSDGCLRDALSILDQSSKSSKNITLEELLKSYNMVSNNSIEVLLNESKNGNISSVIGKIEEFESSGINSQKFIKKFINYLETIAINIKLKEEDRYTYPSIYKLINDLNKCYIDARLNENVFTMIKMALLEFVSFYETNEIKKEVPKKESPIEKKKIQEEKVQNPITNTVAIRINNCFVEAKKENLNELSSKWQELENKKVSSLELKNYKPVVASSTYAMFTAEEDSLTSLFNIKHEDIEKLLKKNKLPIKVVAITNKEWLEEKEKYKKKIKEKEKYEYMEEVPLTEQDNEGIKKEIEDLFTEKIVEIS